MLILLVRHGQAEALHRTDAERNLTSHGREQARQAAAWMHNREYMLDGLFASPYVRAQQTADALSVVLDVPITTSQQLLPDTEPQVVLNWLESLDLPETAVVALVCHMPVVARVAGYLVDGALGRSPGFATAEVSVIEMPLLAAGQGRRIDGFTPP